MTTEENEISVKHCGVIRVPTGTIIGALQKNVL